MAQAHLVEAARIQAQSLVIPEAIETERLRLVASSAGQAEETLEAALESAAELGAWMPWAYPAPTREGVTTYHQSVEAKWAARELLDFQWYEKASGRLIGKGGLHSFNWMVPRGELGYWLRTSMTGQGFCREAVMAMTAFSKQHLGLARLEIRSDPRNTASRRVAERCGFTLDGTLRQDMRDPAGNLRDTCVYGKVLG